MRTALLKPVPTVHVEFTITRSLSSGTQERRPQTGTKMIQGEKSLLQQSSRAMVCQLPSQQDLKQRRVPSLVDRVVNSRFPRRNALQSVLLPDSIKIGLSNCVLIVDSLGTGIRWYRRHSSPNWQVAHEGRTYFHRRQT